MTAAHRSAVEQLLRSTEFFRDVEIDVALEVIDAHSARPEQDYHAVGAFTPGGDLLGYACWGQTPCTAGTWDLYWIAVHRAAQGRGLGTLLLQEVERRLARSDARLVLVETSSQPLYAPTHGFYRANGYAEVARVPDFYTDGDDKVVFAKRIHRPTGQAQP
jgi:ribosomal protein S18 acetylase RimI-like enzyme